MKKTSRLSDKANYQLTLVAYSFLPKRYKIKFLEFVWKNDPFKIEYAKMGKSERKFHTPTAKRSK